MQARLKPYDAKKGHIALTRTFSALGGLRFEGDKVYDVTKAQGEFLATVRMVEGDEKSPLAFDVLSAPAMERLRKAENEPPPAPQAAYEVHKPARTSGGDARVVKDGAR